MPFLEEPLSIDLGKRIDVPKGFTVTPGGEALEEFGPPRPGWNWGAAFRRNNEFSALWSSESAWQDNAPEAGFNPWDKIKGTEREGDWPKFVHVRNSQKFDAVARDIDRENEDRKILASQPWYQSLLTEGPAGILSPTTLLPGGVFVKGAKGGIAIGRSALNVGLATGASAAAQEALLQSIERTRTLGESATAIGASTFLGGLLGAGGAAALNKMQWFRAVRDVDRDVHLGVHVPGTFVPAEALAEGGVKADILARHYPGFEAWHASPHDFDKFDVAKIGTGEGHQAYGHGLYFAENPSTALNYFSTFDRDLKTRTIPGDVQAAVKSIDNLGFDTTAQALRALREDMRAGNDYRSIWDLNQPQDAAALAKIEDYLGVPFGKASMYQVHIRADRENFLDWDAPLSGAVRDKLIAHMDESIAGTAEKWGAISGKDFYQRVASRSSAAEVSRILNESGIHGIKYLDAGSRNIDDTSTLGTRNFVVFDDNLVQIIDKNGKPIAAATSSGNLSSVGAAANTVTDIAGNTIAGRAAAGAAAVTARMNPLLRALHSPSAVYRDIMLNTVENPIYLKKNFEGTASAPAVETLMKEYNAGLAQSIRITDDAFAEHVKVGGQLDRAEFREAIGKAMRRGDTDADPAVTKAAQQWRAKVFDPLKKAAIENGQLPADVSVDTAASYFSRMWNTRAIISDEAGFKGMAREWVDAETPKWRMIFDKETAEREAKLKGEKLIEYQVERRIERSARFDEDHAQDIADDVFNTLTGKTIDGSVRPDFITVKARGPLKERTFSIPDLFVASNGRSVEKYLEHDVEVVGRRYTRIMGADVELARKFGSVDMAEQIDKIRDDYKKLRSEITDEKKRLALSDREKRDVTDLEAVRDMLRGTNPGAPAEGNYARVVRTFGHYNYLRSMGEVAIASLLETVRPAMVHGLLPYMDTLTQTLTNLKGVRLSVKEAQLAGNVSERVLGTRLATLSEIIDPYASRGPIEAFMEQMTNVASKWNGIRLLTDMQKSISAVMTQNRILRGASMFGEVAEKERAYLNFMGIDQSMAERIAKQFAEHGQTIESVRVANTEKWTDDVALRTYRAAINKDVDSIITTKGVADTPLFANTPTGRAFLQFKGFALASHQRVLLRGLQEDQSRFVGGIIAMTAIGIMTTWLKAVSGNRTEKLQDIGDNPGWWIGEGLDKAGIFSVPMELANTFEKASGFNFIKTPIKAFDVGSAISQKNQNRSVLGSVVGPTGGLIDDASSLAGLPKKLIEGEEITQAQKNAAERLMPFNSYFGVRQLLRYTINPQQP